MDALSGIVFSTVFERASRKGVFARSSEVTEVKKLSASTARTGHVAKAPRKRRGLSMRDP
jgi:hypothetical protein